MHKDPHKIASVIQDSPIYLRTDENGQERRDKTAPPARDRAPSAAKKASSDSPAAETKAPRGAAKTQTETVIELGYVNYDNHARENGSCSIIVPAERGKHFRRDIYVGIRDREQGLEFLGRLVEGPFHTPSKPRAASTNGEGKAGYHIHGTVEIIGQLTDKARVAPTTTRPRPNAEIYVFPDHRLQQFLGTNGDFYLGLLSGHSNANVHADSTNANFLPRNVGIFGTVGSGKSNTAQVITEEAIKAGWAVVLIDVEGEYVRMDEPNDEARLIDILDHQYGIPPQEVDDFRVYVPSSGSSAATASLPFKVPISALYPEVVADILEFSEAEIRVFGMVTAQAERLHSTDEPSPHAAGQPRRPYNLQHLIDGLIESSSMSGSPTVRLLPMANEQDVATASTLRSKLLHLGRSNMLDWKDTDVVPELPVSDLLVGGRLSVLDVSETDDRSRNIAIAYILQQLFSEVITTPKGEPMASGQPRPPLLVVIEEVHTFVSRAAAPKMRALLDNLQTISRRGRKRWMALTLVSQQPNHVPNEIFELANTRFIHQVKSPSNINPVKQTTAGVDETLWSSIPALGPGQCLLAGSVFKNPLFVNIRPSQSRRLHTS